MEKTSSDSVVDMKKVRAEYDTYIKLHGVGLGPAALWVVTKNGRSLIWRKYGQVVKDRLKRMIETEEFSKVLTPIQVFTHTHERGISSITYGALHRVNRCYDNTDGIP